ncbi:MAG: NAD(P)/FAD-dependent oxidoreductase, partial [Gammaproteobacteria bacterium]|nr:NAD(P)/FAD-dependent oxidoreductase [Gammaproteobacteria bacterium]
MIDAWVIGAGPAGNQAALSLSARGCSVIVLDYRSEIGDKLCSGIIGAECAEEYRIADKFVWRPFASATIVLPDRKWINVVRDEVHAYVIDRAGFIRDIADRAMANGAEYRLGRKVIDVSFDPNGVTVSAIHREETENYRARCVVLAAGFASKLARDTDLDFPHSVGFAAQTTLSGVKGVGSGGASATDVHVFPKGIVPATAFGWIVPTTGD